MIGAASSARCAVSDSFPVPSSLSPGFKDDGTPVLEYCRWVMVRKRDPKTPAPAPVTPDLPRFVTPDRLVVPAGLAVTRIDPADTGSPFFFEDYEPGERIDHVDGMGVMESEHRLATRLYQNTARVHFNDHTERQGRLGACIVYGGVVISLARALSFNGLGVREGALVLFLHPWAVSSAQAIAAGLLWFLCTLIVSSLGAPSFAIGQRKQKSNDTSALDTTEHAV